MRPLLLALLPLAGGCDPCAGFDGTSFVDTSGALEADTLARLEANLEAFVAATGPDRVCIDRVQVGTGVEPGASLGATGADWYIEIDPAASSPVLDLRTELCRALDLREGIAEQAPALFAERDFAAECGGVFPLFAWHDEAVEACGESPLSAQDEFMAEVVFPLATVGRVDGPLVTTAGAPMRLAGLAAEGELDGYVRLGDGVLLSLRAPDPLHPGRVVYIDLATGETTDVLAPTSRVELYGGADGAVAVETGLVGARNRLHVVDVDTLGVHSFVRTLRAARLAGAVADGALRLVSRNTVGTSVEVVDLSTGVVTEIPFPVPRDPLDVNPTGIVPVPDGFVLAYSEAGFEIDNGMPTVFIGDGVVTRWSEADAAFTELARGFRFSPAGATSDGRLVGPLLGAGDVLGAYAYEDDVLDVSADLCLAETGPLGVIVGRDAWRAETDGEDVVLTPFALD